DVARGGVSERFPDQHVTWFPDGSAIITAKIDNIFWAAQKLLRYGDKVEVLEPPELKQELGRVARAMAKRYGVVTPRRMVAEEAEPTYRAEPDS
ncbi:MAG: WYL domain-containing protein, partial [Chloroflexi bacterium]|nr:WYL domain-containing protein [Chloroflexota bacterium]